MFSQFSWRLQRYMITRKPEEAASGLPNSRSKPC